jgi:transposase
MVTKVCKPRAYCRERQNSYSLSPISPKSPKRIVDTVRRTRLLRDAKHTAGKIPRTELFKQHGISIRTGYRILREGTSRRSQALSNRGRKRLLQPQHLEAIETVENSSFRFASSTHYAVACLISITQASERTVQRNMAEFGVGTYRAAQKKFLPEPTRKLRVIWAFERRRWSVTQFQSYRYSDESHFACLLQRQAMVHRRPGTEARNQTSKIQFKYKRENQVWHVFGIIGWNYKSQLHFYTGTGKGGRLKQVDYITFLEDVVAPDWDSGCIFLRITIKRMVQGASPPVKSIKPRNVWASLASPILHPRRT